MKNLVLDCGDECSFNLADGRKIRSLSELSKSLENMDDNVFRHHVNDGRNDFSTWIRDVIKDEELANDMLATKDRNGSQLLVLKRILELIKEITK